MKSQAIYQEFRLALLNMISAAEAIQPSLDTKSLLNELNQAKEGFESLCRIQKKLIGIYPVDLLPHLWNDLSSHYQRILPIEAEQNLPKLDEQPALRQQQYRTACLAVSTWIFRYYRFIGRREKLIADAKQSLCGIFAVILLPTIILSFRGELYPGMGMLIAGMLGAGVSIVRRMQQAAIAPVDGQDRETVLIQLDCGKWGMYLSLISGCIFPFVLYMILLSHMVTDGTTALLSLQTSASGGVSVLPPVHFDGTSGAIDFDLPMRPTDPLYAKVLVWSFISGFAERFVPDVLDRLVNKAMK